jgi:DTW domain-containing protein YfiP
MSNSHEAAELSEAIADCERCQKPRPLCVCDDVERIDSRISLLILQHPQEQDRALGTARLTAQHFANAVVKVGLSWPSLSKADLDTDADLVAITRKGEIAENQRAIFDGIEGVILLDGTWSQAKALWWRNPWMLKCQRVILGPLHPSRYGRLRKEPRRDGLSTIEAAGMLLARLQKRPDIEAALAASFDRMLARFREVQKSSPELAPKPRPRRKRDFRRRKP